MPTSEEWDDLFWEKAQAAKSASSLDKSLTERSADELIALRNQSTNSNAATRGARGLRFTKLLPPAGGGD